MSSSDLVLRAISFAVRAHRHQLRKDNLTPYAAHPMRVCFIVRHLFEVDDEEVLATAVLHDTIEDTNTDYDDLIEEFGVNVATWVGLLSKDKRRPEAEREEEFRQQLIDAPWQVHLCKLADLYDNLADSKDLTEKQLERAYRRTNLFLQRIESKLNHRTRYAGDQVRAFLEDLMQNRVKQ
jgi:(p)ppGpp synthase/HD superfamily hydrolase